MDLDKLNKAVADAVSAQTGAELIAVERRRQVVGENYSAGHDDFHTAGELAKAAACYALGGKLFIGSGCTMWPWPDDSWKPSPHDRIRELVKAGALIAAEIDRLKRLAIRGTHRNAK